MMISTHTHWELILILVVFRTWVLLLAVVFVTWELVFIFKDSTSIH